LRQLAERRFADQIGRFGWIVGLGEENSTILPSMTTRAARPAREAFVARAVRSGLDARQSVP